MTERVIITTRVRWRPAVPVLCLATLVGCNGLAGPDGMEAALIERAERLPRLSADGAGTPSNVASAGLLLNPSVRDAAAQVSASADEVRVSRAALFPALGLSLGGGVGDAGAGAAALELNGQQLLTDFGRTDRDITSADIELQIDHLEFQQSVDEALIEVLIAYAEVDTYTRLLDLRREQLAAMTELETLVQQRVENGATSSSDLLETRKRVQLAAFEVQDAELSLGEARDRLTRLSGQSQGGELPTLQGDCIAPGGSDAWRIARLRIAKARLDLQQAQAARRPGVVISPIARSEIGGGETGLGLNLGINSDLLQGGALTARARAALNTLVGAAAAAENAEREDALEIRHLRREIDAATQRYDLLDRQIGLLQETRTLYRDQYFDLGTRQLSDLLDNEADFYESRAEYVELGSELTENRLRCAARDRSLRTAFEVRDKRLYNLPLDWDNLPAAASRQD